MKEILNWLDANVYHTSLCDKESRVLGNKCICGKSTALAGVEQMQAAIKVHQKIITDQEKQLVDLQVEACLRAGDFREVQKEKGLLKERIETLEELLECSYKTSDDSEEERSSENES